MKKDLRELILLLTDAYKLFHRQMYPSNTITVYSNGTPRASRHYKGDNNDYVVVFGTQRLVRVLKDKFQVFFDMPEDEVIDFCKNQLTSFTGAEYDVEHIVYLHRLQKLPLVIKSLPEGTKCPIKVPYMTFYNTDPQCFWLTNYLETFISTEIWASITNATIANEYREIFEKWSLETVGNTDFVPFQGHDFSMRGMFGAEAARMSGLAHLTSFSGSDTIPSYLDAQYYYDSGENDWSQFPQGIVATSVPASEHSVQCAHFDPETGDELAYLDHLLNEFIDAPVLSIVCDGYDYWKMITKIIPMRKDEIMARSGKVVVRPDSGNIVDIICGTLIEGTYSASLHEAGRLHKLYYDGEQLYKVNTINYDEAGDVTTYEVGDNMGYTQEELKGSIQVLAEIFGTTVNSKGFLELNEHIGLIYGDSVTLQIADEVCRKLAQKGFASTSWVAGIGSYTYQFNTRDSHGQAIKATYVEFDEKTTVVEEDLSVTFTRKTVGKNIFKDPKTGDGMKKSAKGLVSVEYGEAQAGIPRKLELIDEVSWEQERSPNNKLVEILRDGELKNQTTLQQIRKRLRNENK